MIYYYIVYLHVFSCYSTIDTLISFLLHSLVLSCSLVLLLLFPFLLSGLQATTSQLVIISPLISVYLFSVFVCVFPIIIVFNFIESEGNFLVREDYWQTPFLSLKP